MESVKYTKVNKIMLNTEIKYLKINTFIKIQ